jgi:hypothetical protein
MNKLQLLPVAAYRCRSGESYYPLLTGTIFDNTRQRPVTLVLLRGMAKGEPPAWCASWACHASSCIPYGSVSKAI